MGIQILNGASLSSILQPVSMADVQAIRETSAAPAGDQGPAPSTLANTTPAPPSSLLSGDTLAQILQLTQSDPPAETAPAAPATGDPASPDDTVTFPPANAPQNVQDAWNAATSGLGERQKMTLTAFAAFPEQHWTLQDGKLVSGASGEPADFDYAKFAQSMIESLQNSASIDTTPTEQASLRTNLAAFQQFAANLAAGST